MLTVFNGKYCLVAKNLKLFSKSCYICYTDENIRSLSCTGGFFVLCLTLFLPDKPPCISGGEKLKSYYLLLKLL